MLNGSRDVITRPAWMAVLAKAQLADLEHYVQFLENLPTYGYLRSPEIGLAVVRGRAGGDGLPFNLGEMTITRCVVQLLDSAQGETMTGFGYVAGRSQRHAELAAICDALLQDPSWHDVIIRHVIQPLQTQATQRQQQQDQQVESTRVNFFTMVRGEV